MKETKNVELTQGEILVLLSLVDAARVLVSLNNKSFKEKSEKFAASVQAARDDQEISDTIDTACLALFDARDAEPGAPAAAEEDRHFLACALADTYEYLPCEAFQWKCPKKNRAEICNKRLDDPKEYKHLNQDDRHGLQRLAAKCWESYAAAVRKGKA